MKRLKSLCLNLHVIKHTLYVVSYCQDMDGQIEEAQEPIRI